jgi:Ca-activated chloride channel family protein
MTDGVNTVLNAMPPQIAAELAKITGSKSIQLVLEAMGLQRFRQGLIFLEILFLQNRKPKSMKTR